MRLRSFGAVTALAAALLTGCGGEADHAPPLTTLSPSTAPTTTAAAPAPLDSLAAEVIATGFSLPVWATSPPGQDRLFVVEQSGTVRELTDDGPADEPYLDVTRFVNADGLEQGLLGMAFHPDFAANGRVFVSFTNVDGDTRIMEYVEDPRNPSRIDPGTGRLIFALEQPHQYHNGGMIQFGPDGMLWMGLGDGGGIGDTWQHGQNPHTLLGTLIRIDVNADGGYAIPADNPFADGVDGAPEVYAIGLRNPWRFTFADDSTMFIADVGQEGWEEVNVLEIPDDAGSNYGWSVMEGPDCYHKDEERKGDSCDTAGLVVPDFLVEHYRACAIVGGPVYRGAAIPELTGRYFYGDYCVGWVRSITWDGTIFSDETDWSDQLGDLGQIASLAEDPQGEILILSMDGTVRRVVPVR